MIVSGMFNFIAPVLACLSVFKLLGSFDRLRELPWRGIAAVFGGFLLQFTMGAFYSFGNMSTYMTSYMRQNGSPHISYTGRYV